MSDDEKAALCALHLRWCSTTDLRHELMHVALAEVCDDVQLVRSDRPHVACGKLHLTVRVDRRYAKELERAILLVTPPDLLAEREALGRPLTRPGRGGGVRVR